MTTLNRRASGQTLIALAATAAATVATGATVVPTLAATTTAERAALRAASVKQAADLRTFRKFQEAIDLLTPFAGDKDFDVLIEMGRNVEGFTTPADRLEAVEWYTQAITLKPTSVTGYQRRASAYGDAGFRHFEQRLADRQKVVDLGEAASPEKTAGAGDYADLAGAHNSFVAPRGGGLVDMDRAQLVLDLRSKAIELGETYGRLLDRAEHINSRFNNPGAGREDVDRALYLVHRRMDTGKPATWYAQGQATRRVASLPALMTLAGATVSVSGAPTFQLRPNATRHRSMALDAYSRYIAGFEESGRDYSKFGDALGAYENRASVYRSLSGKAHREAIDDMTTLIGLNPRNAEYYRLRAVSLDAISERLAARPDYEKYLELNGSEDLGEVGGTRARLLKG
jgi:tetratricopeptide (TPR) repeat protein